MSTVEEAIDAVRRGEPIVLPTDTVYGLAADGLSRTAAAALYAAKGRQARQPTALVLASVDLVSAALPRLPRRSCAWSRRSSLGPSPSFSPTRSIGSRG